MNSECSQSIESVQKSYLFVHDHADLLNELRQQIFCTNCLPRALI